jgi:nitroreductase
MTRVDSGPVETMERLLVGRRSCRAFRDTPVPRVVIERLLTLAQQSPSWCNTQPWELIVTEGAATNRLPSPASPDITFPTSYPGVYGERRRVCAQQLYSSVGIDMDDRAASYRQTMKNFEFFGAPNVIIMTTAAPLGTYGLLDCGVYLGNLLLAAQALGLGAIAQAALALHSPLIRRHFDILPDRKIVCGISIGYPDSAHPTNSFQTRRGPISEVATFHVD